MASAIMHTMGSNKPIVTGIRVSPDVVSVGAQSTVDLLTTIAHIK